jgi:hypothetical protein
MLVKNKTIINSISTQEKVSKILDIGQYNILQYYLKQDITNPNKLFNPYRDILCCGIDNKPSCYISSKKINDTDWLIFNDRAIGYSANIFGLAATKYGLSLTGFVNKELFSKTVDLLYNEITNSEDLFDIDEDKIIEKKLLKKSTSTIEVFPKIYSEKELNYWKQYNIELNDLIDFKVFACSKVVINGKTFLRSSTEDICFAYKFQEGKYKIYRPESLKEYKWRTNTSEIDNINFIENDLVILTKSRKDRIVLKKMGFESYSYSSETLIPDKLAYKTKYILYDNDNKDFNTGQEFAKQIAQKFNLLNLEIPSKYKCSDISDLVKKVGFEKSKEILLGLI